MNSMNRSSLRDPAHTKRLLKKLKDLYASRPRSLVFVINGARVEAKDLTALTIDEEAADDQIVLDQGGGNEFYSVSEIVDIRRLRSRRWMIKLSYAADPAEETA